MIKWIFVIYRINVTKWLFCLIDKTKKNNMIINKTKLKPNIFFISIPSNLRFRSKQKPSQKQNLSQLLQHCGWTPTPQPPSMKAFHRHTVAEDPSTATSLPLSQPLITATISDDDATTAITVGVCHHHYFSEDWTNTSNKQTTTPCMRYSTKQDLQRSYPIVFQEIYESEEFPL